MIPCDGRTFCSGIVSDLLTRPRSTMVDANTSYEILQKAVSEHISQFELHCHSIVQLLHEQNERLKTSLAIARSMRLAEDKGTEMNVRRKSQDLQMPLTPCTPPEPVAPPSPVDVHPLMPGRASRRVVSNANKRVAGNGRRSLECQRASWHPLTDLPLEPTLNRDQEGTTSASVLTSGSSALHIISEVFANSATGISRDSAVSQTHTPESVVANWERMFTNICTPKENRRQLKVQKTGLLQTWTVHKPKNFANTEAVSAQTTEDSFIKHHRSTQGHYIYNDYGLRVGKVIKSRNSCIRVVHPASKYCILHSVVQGALVLFEVVDFPLSAFRTSRPKHADIALFISVFFWTWDLIFSFLQGFVSDTGVIEMRPSKIAFNYIRSWFIFDLTVVIFDWVCFVAFILEETMGSDANLAMAARLGKVQRLARGGRILRLAKLVEACQAFINGTSSEESVVVIARIVGLLLLIILINHYIACAWYAIAEGNDREDTWIKANSIINYSMFDRYFYSLHWSLTQFTPCTNNIAPANGEERAFACLVVICALVIFSTFLSSLTGATMQMKKLNWQRYSEQVQIRDFMQGKQIPLTVAHRVWKYYRKHYRLKNRSVVESEVIFFQAMPKSLRKEMRCHAYIPSLTHHPVMQEIIVNPQHCMGPTLCESVSVLVPVSGQDVFLEGEDAAHLYYFVNGSGTYTFSGGDQMLSAPDHVSEAALWLRDWQHPGRLTVTNNRCELLLVGSARFTSCMEGEAAPSTVQCLRKYASLFAQYQQDLQSDETQEESQPLPSFRGKSLSSNTPFGHTMTNIRRRDVARNADLALPPSVHAELIGRAFFRFEKYASQASIGSHASFPGEAFKNRFVKLMHKFSYSSDARRSDTRRKSSTRY